MSAAAVELPCDDEPELTPVPGLLSVAVATLRIMTKTVPHTGCEKESLHVALDRHRDVVLWKLDGLDDEQLRRPMTPTGTNLLGLVKHLATVEYG